VFVLVIGPINLMLLSRWKRRLWLLWTVPAISGLTVAAVFGYMVLAEGWSRHQRTQVITVKDENTGRATTIGWTAFYSPVTPAEGLRFGYETEVALKGENYDDSDPYSRHYGHRRRSSGRSCYLDLTQDQHLEKGWMTARVPTHFQVRKSEKRLEGVTVRKKDHTYVIVNGLPSTIRKLSFADAEGVIHTALSIPPGQERTLDRTEDKVRFVGKSLRDLYKGDWLMAYTDLSGAAATNLRPLTYLAEVEDTPFLEDGLARTKYRNCKSMVLGILKEVQR
jgi:hypothetical protein